MRWKEKRKTYIFGGTQVTLVVETVEYFGGRAEKLFQLAISKLKVHLQCAFKMYILNLSLSCLSKLTIF